MENNFYKDFETKNPLLRNLPFYERSSEFIKDIMDAIWYEFKLIIGDVTSLKDQFFVDTATWGLKYFEKELGLPTNDGASIEERRAIIKASYISDNKSSIDMIRGVVSELVRGDAIVEYDGDAVLKLLISTIGLGSLFNFKQTMDKIKPAHIDYEFSIIENDDRATVKVVPIITCLEKIEIKANFNLGEENVNE